MDGRQTRQEQVRGEITTGEVLEARGRTGTIRILRRRIKRYTAGKQDGQEILSKNQEPHGTRKEGTEKDLEGK